MLCCALSKLESTSLVALLIFPWLLVHGWATQPLSSRSSTLPLHASFDFSSMEQWNTFYQDRDEVFEWHSSVSLERIASYVPNNSDCLMVGCGNSLLPQVILSDCDNPRIVLLDTSQTCIDQLQERYGLSVECTCGDATKLSSLWNKTRKFDIIVDKGLADAIFCGEGFDGPLTELFQAASGVIRKGGAYLLISYKLQPATKEFLVELGDSFGFEWEFDLADSNDRVSVSMARRQ